MMGIKQNEWFGVLRVKLLVFAMEKDDEEIIYFAFIIAQSKA